jgi:hypothetical protein
LGVFLCSAGRAPRSRAGVARYDAAVILAPPSERRASTVAVAGALLVFVLLLIAVPPFYRSFDESKYLGIGYNMFAGAGPRTVFGAVFLPHSPLWPMVVVAPDVWLGIDPWAWGHILNGLAGVVLLALVAALGWPIRPAVGALAVVGYLAIPYLHDLTRTARLDVPAAALALLYVVVGLDAVRRGSVARGLLAGLVFAIAFLVKEIALPFAPVPFIVGILAGRPLVSLARVGAATLAVAAIGTSWWFVMFAGFTRQVYRLGTPSITLIPLAIAVVVAVAVGLASPSLASNPTIATRVRAVRRRVAPGDLRHGRAIAGWGLAFAWFVAFVIFFDRNPELKGNGLFQAGQYVLYARTWLSQLPLLLGAIGAGLGVILSFAARRALEPGRREQLDALYVTMLCTLPLILLVIAVGEPPRNYLAQLGVLAIMSATGWLWVAERVLPRVRSPLLAAVVALGGAAFGAFIARVVVVPTAIGLAVGGAIGLWLGISLVDVNRRDADRRVGRLTPGVVGALIGLVLLVSTTLLADHALGYRESASGSARERAAITAADWIEANVPPETKVGFGSFLGYETAIDVAGYRMVQIHQSLAAVDPSATYALAAGGEPVEDAIALEVSRREKEFYVFRGDAFAQLVKRSGIGIYVYHTGPTTSVPALLGALTPEHGFTELASWSYPAAGVTADETTTSTHIFAVDPGRVGFGGTPLYATTGALSRLVAVLERDPGRTAAAAGALVDHLAVWPASASADDLLDRLRSLAER